MLTSATSTHQIWVTLDRVQLVSGAPPSHKPPLDLEGFAICRDTFVRCQTTASTYARSREYRSLEGDTKINWQYCRQKGWLAPWKISIAPDDKQGLTRDLLERVLRHCCDYRFITVEVAINFSSSSGINRRFVLRHGVFGKSRKRA
jgi:hypothetical protein